MTEGAFLTFKEVAEYLGVTNKHVYQLEDEGWLPQVVRIDNFQRGFHEEEITRWADQEWWGKRGRVRPSSR